MLYHLRKAVIADEIVVFIVPYKLPRADYVVGSSSLELLFQLLACARENPPLIILKANFLPRRDGGVDLIDVVIYTFVHRLDTIFNANLPLQLLRLFLAGEVLEFFMSCSDLRSVINLDDCTASTKSFSSGS